VSATRAVSQLDGREGGQFFQGTLTKQERGDCLRTQWHWSETELSWFSDNLREHQVVVRASLKHFI